MKDTVASLKTSLAASTETIAQLQKNNSEADRALKKAEQERLSIENQLHELEDASAASTAGEHDAGRYWQGVAYVAFGGLITLLIIDASYLFDPTEKSEADGQSRGKRSTASVRLES